MSRKIAILGGGESGIGAALLALKKGYTPFVSDFGALKEDQKAELKAAGIAYEEGTHSMDLLLEADLVIKSPGIPDKAAAVKALRSAGKPVISEIEFASWFNLAKTIGITGSNGKTTTTYLTYHLMKCGGVNVEMGGNVGVSFARMVAQEQQPDWYVLELSSFQLDGIMQYRPDIALLITITPDHLDRYEYQMAQYVASKFRIIKNQRKDDWFFFNRDAEAIQSYLKGQSALAMNHKGLSASDVQDGKLSVKGHSFDFSASSLKGPHNMINAHLAIAAALEAGASAAGIQEGLNTFTNVPHRLEKVGTLEGVTWINDSKATNVDSVFWALKAMEQPTILILGGLDKGNDYNDIEPLVVSKVKAIVAMGVDNEKIMQYFESKVKQLASTHSLQEAVQAARSFAQSGDVVLLSPACASFDLFKNYEDRGDQFRNAVLALGAE